jgi:hypothetical protein
MHHTIVAHGLNHSIINYGIPRSQMFAQSRTAGRRRVFRAEPQWSRMIVTAAGIVFALP